MTHVALRRYQRDDPCFRSVLFISFDIFFKEIMVAKEKIEGIVCFPHRDNHVPFFLNLAGEIVFSVISFFFLFVLL